ncbi:MAG TPA: hypothetical protein VHE55_09925 [Fimbriimonadaceae bacterium]|nr:hypothetical protein [Fimbriimonadaceae bacterium]
MPIETLLVKDPLTIADVARLLTVNEKSVRRYIAAGLLESITLAPGSRAARRVTQAQYRAYLKKREFTCLRSR